MILNYKKYEKDVDPVNFNPEVQSIDDADWIVRTLKYINIIIRKSGARYGNFVLYTDSMNILKTYENFLP